MSRRTQSASPASAPAPPHDPEALRTRIIDRYPRLSARLQQIARFALENPRDMALETVAAIAGRAAVQPSAVVRFAQSVGFSGFSEMQRLYHAALRESVPSYGERLRRSHPLTGETPPRDAGEILRELCAAGTASLQHLHEELPAQSLERALEMLQRARVAHVLGLRRSFPVAAHLAHALNQAGCRAHLVTGVAGLFAEQAQLIEPRDVLIAISAHPYAPETLALTEAASSRHVPIIAVTDSLVSPLARLAALCLVVREAEQRGLRSLTASLCLAETLAVAWVVRRAGEPRLGAAAPE